MSGATITRELEAAGWQVTREEELLGCYLVLEHESGEHLEVAHDDELEAYSGAYDCICRFWPELAPSAPLEELLE